MLKNNQAGRVPYTLLVILFIVCIFIFHSIKGHALDDSNIVKSGVAGYCLDVHHNDKASGAVVDTYKCNNSQAQSWQINSSSIEHADMCLTIDATNSIVMQACNQASNQVWLRDKTGFMNPNSQLCLSLPAGKTGKPLIASDCGQLSSTSETWQTSDDISAQTCQGTEGQKVACYADLDYAQWQSGTVSHETLLNKYTDGAAYEEWCADFVSYVYKQAGYPFTGGYDGWDENIASQIQYLGFTKHDAAGYTPKTGDVAFFNYPGGHVEIVVSSGSQPTFVYGNSATVDPTTGNGQMQANTITQDGSYGQLVYYLSPN